MKNTRFGGVGRVLLVATLMLLAMGTVSAQSLSHHWTWDESSCPIVDQEGSLDTNTCSSGLSFGETAPNGLGTAVDFGTGSSDYARAGNWQEDQSFTVSMVVKPKTNTTDTVGGSSWYFSKSGGGGNYDISFLESDSGDFRFLYGSSDNEDLHIGDGTVNAGEYQRFTFAMNTSGATGYVGDDSGTVSADGPYNQIDWSNADVAWGEIRPGSGAYNDFVIADMKTWDYRLSDSEVEGLINSDPKFNSVSTSPSSWTVGSSIDVSADVSDSDGTVSSVEADVWENGSQIVSDASLSD